MTTTILLSLRDRRGIVVSLLASHDAGDDSQITLRFYVAPPDRPSHDSDVGGAPTPIRLQHC